MMPAIARPGTAQGAVPGGAALPDTSGTAVVEWAYDTWTAPWVQVAGASRMLAPASHATLVVLSCANSNLERDRIVRRLSLEECEHQMAAIRADQDTALVFRLDLRVFSFPGSDDLAGLNPQTTLMLEDDRGRSWSPIDTRRGPALVAASGEKLKRAYYHPPWLRGVQHLTPYPNDVRPERDLTVAEHFIRFARRDPRWREPIVDRHTRWLRLRLSTPGYEWVATWPLRRTLDSELE